MRSVWSRALTAPSSMALAGRSGRGEREGRRELRARDRELHGASVQRPVAANVDRGVPVGRVDLRAELRQRFGDAAHRPAAQRVVAVESRIEIARVASARISRRIVVPELPQSSAAARTCHAPPRMRTASAADAARPRRRVPPRSAIVERTSLPGAQVPRSRSSHPSRARRTAPRGARSTCRRGPSGEPLDRGRAGQRRDDRSRLRRLVAHSSNDRDPGEVVDDCRRSHGT